MGIKEIFKSDRCITCEKKLEVFAWKKCRECTNKKKNRKLKGYKVHLSTMIVDKYSDVLKLYKIAHTLKGVDLSEKDYLVYDETGTIIGYRNKYKV